MRSLLLTAAALLVPSLVHASDIRVASYEMSETGGVILIESDAPIGEPWMRTDARAVRIWFPDVKYVARFEHARDAHEPIRALQLRPGADDSAVLRIEFGPGQKFDRDNVEVTREGQTARVRVRLSVAPAPVPPAPAVAAAPAPAPAPSKPLYAPAQPVAAQVQAAAPAPETKPAPAAISSIRAAAAATDKEGLQFSTGSRGGLTGLAIISGLLLAAYAGIRSLNKKRPQRSADIQVLSTRRLGHRSELLVVRALGADHLLVTSAGRVERVTSVPSPLEPSLSLPPAPIPTTAPAVDADSQAEGLGIISKLSSRSRLRKLLDAVEQEPAEPAPAPVHDSRRPSFGPELLSAIHHHKLSAVASLPPLAAANVNANKQSEAVAGIARLRAGTRSN